MDSTPDPEGDFDDRPHRISGFRLSAREGFLHQGASLVMEVTQQQTGHDPAAGFGVNGKPDLWIGGEGGLNKPVHVAILAKDRSAVDAFYEAAIAAGGRDNGAPGIRAHYHPDYYGAFVLDPDGHNIEAVCHASE
jgi:catechol 2,3-dioxygenase-like lactoylglutathione lyase family enzyme